MQHSLAALFDRIKAVVGVTIVEEEANEIEEIGRVDAFSACIPGCKAMTYMRPNAVKYDSQVLHGFVCGCKDTKFF